MTAFNSDLRKLIKDEVERTLLSRDKMGTLKSEVDFIMGACSVMRVVNMYLYTASDETSMDCIPPMWLLYPMSGRSMVTEINNNTDDSEGRNNDKE